MFSNASFRGLWGAGRWEVFEVVLKLEKENLTKLGLDATSCDIALKIVDHCLQKDPTDRYVSNVSIFNLI